MSRIPTPANIASAPAAARPILEALEKQIGMVPNLFRVMANSPSALEGAMRLDGALARGGLGLKTRERIALAVSELNDCAYCISAHSYVGKNLANLDDAELQANREGGSTDPKADAAVRFASKIVTSRGHVSDADVQKIKTAGYDDAQVIEIVVHVAMTTLTNYVNEVAKTEIDFPVVVQRTKER